MQLLSLPPYKTLNTRFPERIKRIIGYHWNHFSHWQNLTHRWLQNINRSYPGSHQNLTMYSWPSVSTDSTNHGSKIFGKNSESSTKENIHLPHATNNLHSICTVLGTANNNNNSLYIYGMLYSFLHLYIHCHEINIYALLSSNPQIPFVYPTVPITSFIVMHLIFKSH